MQLRFAWILLLTAWICKAEVLPGWIPRNAGPFTAATYDGTYVSNRFVVGGADGVLRFSANGTNWTSGQVFGDQDIMRLYFVDGREIYQTIDKSAGRNASLWVKTPEGMQRIGNYYPSSVAGGHGVVLIVEDGKLYELDGVELRRSESTFQPEEVVFGDQGFFVGIDKTGDIATSLDGKNWELRGNTPCRHLQTFQGKYLAASPGQLVTSTDGVTWERRFVETPEWLFGVVLSEQGGIIFGQDLQLRTQYAWSHDLKEWNFKNFPFRERVLKVLYGNGTFVALNYWGVSGTSTNTMDWVDFRTGPIADYQSLAAGNGVFVAVGSGPDGRNIAWSKDGTNWNEVVTGTANGVTQSFAKVVFGGGRFVACGRNGTFASSTDGANWSYSKADTDQSSFDLMWTGTEFLALARLHLLRSSDGENWARFNLPGVFYHFCSDGKQFGLVGPEAGVRMTEDFKSFRYVQTDGMPLNLSYARGHFVMTTLGGIRVSRDGVKWEPVEGPPMSSVKELGGRIVAAAGNVLSDWNPGVGWTPIARFPGLQIWDVLWSGNRLLAVGAGGAIIEAKQLALLGEPEVNQETIELPIFSVGTLGLETSSDLQHWESIPFEKTAQGVRLIKPISKNAYFRSKMRP